MPPLKLNETMDLIQAPLSKVIGKWVFAVKLNLDGYLTCIKAKFVAKGYSQTYGVDYHVTFSLIMKMTSVRLLTSLVAI